MGAPAARVLVRGAGRSIGRAGNLPFAAMELIREVTDFVSLIQREKTKRTAIKTRRDVLVARIRAETALIETHLHGQFRNRSLVFQNLLGLYCMTLEHGRPPEESEKILDAITILVREDPIADAVQAFGCTS